MRILYLSQYFPPEAGATQTRAHEMARALVQAGHAVTMLAEFPNHPSGIIPARYRGKLFERDNLDGIEVIRVWVKASPQKTFASRMAFYLSFMCNAVLAGLCLARQRYDLVLATSPPLFTAAAGLALSTLRRLPLVIEVRDLWPAAAIALGELRNPAAIRWATRLEEGCYRRAEKIIVVTRRMQQALEQRGIDSAKLAWIPNGANTELFQFNGAARQKIRRELDLERKFVALYAGILGIAQGLETILQAARLLQNEPDFQFVLIGDGPQRAHLLRLKAELGLENVSILPEKPGVEIPGYLSAADVALIPLRRLELFEMAVPSKLFDAWACERPVVCAIAGEAQEIVDEARGGINVPAEDPVALAQAVRTLAAEPARRQAMGERGREITRRQYARQELARRLIETLQEVVIRPGK